ncbi:helix-turn-helix domain-containing protein [Comamonas thiooxydans]|jgi:DNA-binding transcriptional MerR regulator|uniref:Helix-turn-helix domain-containing protein n=1 Tax=Comamonas thiooxydans TaxID=363952 RepID=A0AA42Q1V4_9BURK|nr:MULTISPECIES: helix-turn-helix domain-containing protein [Comamonas]MDH1255578.1 helix-turn-helix domain-containing protein [Comamonas thiooxydans]MDH1335412.1 helix-turn-helix domain-containing protein [Comamonas thiooxydans]MDH1741557.1 helix-turn-helix domain-containing protein [Comamonas thiooxydans]MDH1787879.1 helix-turn-helix domain-containing protein [Comamonas thiooxydans]TFF59517.1 MerR family transcriptional regulator [Comamonas sp. A23]
MDITEVAKRTGLSAPTLRFYEEKGLIRSIGRHGQRRLFDAQVLEHLSVIALGRAAGFSLDEIRAMLPLDGNIQVPREMLLAKADLVERSIKQLKAVRDGLRHAANCPEKNHLDCPTFQRLMHAALAGKIQPLTVAASKAKST